MCNTIGNAAAHPMKDIYGIRSISITITKYYVVDAQHRGVTLSLSMLSKKCLKAIIGQDSEYESDHLMLGNKNIFSIAFFLIPSIINNFIFPFF